MRQALWFLLKLGLFISALMWVAARPGHVEIIWLGYLIETSVSVLLALGFAVLFLWTYGYKIWQTFIHVPDAIRRYRIAKKQAEGYQAITHGFVAIAAGDTKSATKYAKTAENRLPDMPLSRLLQAQTYLMTGHTVKARRTFNALLENNDAAFFGLRGLLNDALYHKNYTEALRLIRQTAKIYPHQPWVLQILFDLETRKMEWASAQKTLKTAHAHRVFDRDTFYRHQQALHIALSEELTASGHDHAATRQLKKAFGLNTGWAPATLRLAEHYISKDKKRAAIKTLQTAWQQNPHPDMAVQFLSLIPPAKKSESIYDAGKQQYTWMKKLTDKNPDHPLSHYVLGKTAEQGRLWADARVHFNKINDTVALDALYALENNPVSTTSLQKINFRPDHTSWCCGSCDTANPRWHVLCPTCGVFNNSEWRIPSPQMFLNQNENDNAQKNIGLDLFSGGLISPPQPH